MGRRAVRAQALGLPASAVRSFVLDNDPVPRAMLSADPAFALLKQSAPVSWLLQVRCRPPCAPIAGACRGTHVRRTSLHRKLLERSHRMYFRRVSFAFKPAVQLGAEGFAFAVWVLMTALY